MVGDAGGSASEPADGAVSRDGPKERTNDATNSIGNVQPNPWSLRMERDDARALKPGPHKRSGGPGILAKYTAADRGLVEAPMLAPHLRFHVLDERTVILRSGRFDTAIHGACHPDLLPLLGGDLRASEIIARLAGKYRERDVRTALVSLASSGYVVSAEFDMKRESAAFWTARGASPRWASERLAATAVSVSGDAGQFAMRLQELGLRIDPDNPTMSVFVCADYLDGENAAINRHHLSSAKPWTLVHAGGILSLFGPVFRPGDDGPCWECLAFRLRANRMVESFVRETIGDDTALPVADVLAFTHAVYGLAATEIAKWVVLGDLAPLHQHAVSFEPSDLEIQQNWVGRRPQCRACGNRSMFRPDRPTSPVHLRPSPKPVRNSGGLRAVPPETTIERFRHLVSPVSGVVTELRRISDVSVPWLHVHAAQTNPVAVGRNLHELAGGVRGGSAGKGNSSQQSEASALCEALEICSGSFCGEEIRCERRFVDFPDAGGAEAIHPNEIELISDRQFDRPNWANAAMDGSANWIPARFDSTAKIDWSPVWSLTRGCNRYLPTALLYFGVPEERGAKYCKAKTNGCSAGNTLEEAILQGFLELVERDCVAIWWYNRIRRPEVDLDSFNHEYLAAAKTNYNDWNRKLWVLDVTGDLGIPVFVAVSHRTDGEDERILFGFGSHLDPRIAALRAVCEMNQVLPSLHGRNSGSPGTEGSALRGWLQSAKIAGHTYLMPDPGSSPRRMTDYPVPETRDIKDDIEFCRALVERKGFEFLVLDQTRPDIGMPVARVIVPGLRHYSRRLAPGRLYDVPVELGWIKRPLTETDLNPCTILL